MLNLLLGVSMCVCVYDDNDCYDEDDDDDNDNNNNNNDTQLHNIQHIHPTLTTHTRTPQVC